MEPDKEKIENVLRNYELDRFSWIDPSKIVVSHWVRMKCMFGCSSYDQKASCPPNVPDVNECSAFFKEYKHGLIIHVSARLDDPEKRDDWSKGINNKLLKAEREIFLLGNRKAFVLFMDECQLCADCGVSREDCKNKKNSRPSPEGMAVDVFETVKRYGFPIKVLDNYDQEMNRYSILLID